MRYYFNSVGSALLHFDGWHIASCLFLKAKSFSDKVARIKNDGHYLKQCHHDGEYFSGSQGNTCKKNIVRLCANKQN